MINWWPKKKTKHYYYDMFFAGSAILFAIFGLWLFFTIPQRVAEVYTDDTAEVIENQEALQSAYKRGVQDGKDVTYPIPLVTAEEFEYLVGGCE